MVIPPQLLAGAAALCLIAGFGAGWSVRDAFADSAALKAVEKAEKLREAMQGKVDGKGAELEALLAEHRPAAIQTQTQIREIYRDVKVPAECAVPDAALGVLDGALDRASAEATGEPRRTMPAAGSAPAGDDRP
jgi:hypothetical protein